MVPVIALVGRPNVGKSTLFNRLTRTRDAIVGDLSGLTRDRQYGEAKWQGRSYIIVDTGGISGDEHGMDEKMAEQSLLAIEEADVVLFLVDARAGYTAADWSTDVAVAVLDSMRQRPWPTGFRVLARDLADTWEYGDLSATPAPPTVTGESRDLAWWLTGRGEGETLTSDDTDQLPEVPPW